MRCSSLSILLLSALIPSAAKPGAEVSADATAEMIPNTLMQSDKEPPSAESIAPWTRSTGLNVTFLDDCAGERYLESAWGSRFVSAFRSLRSGAFKCDFLRLAYIADRGGFYADTDSCAADVTLETLRQRAARSNASLILTESYWKPNGKRFNFNGFFAARPKHAALIRLAHMAVDNIEQRLGANFSAKSPAPGFCDCATGCCAMAIAGPALMHHLFKEPDTLVLPEVDRGEVFDPASKRTVLTKCKKDATKAVYWEKQFARNQIYWPEGSSPTSACTRAHSEVQADAQPQTPRPQLMIMHGGHFIYEPFVRTLADGVAGLPSASAWNVSVHTLVGAENAWTCDDSTTPGLIRKRTRELKEGDIFVFVGPLCANQVPWPELKAQQPGVLRVFWQVEPNAYLSHDCERYLGFNSINAWSSTPSRYDCSFCGGGKFPKDAGKMILLNKQAEAADLLDNQTQKAQTVAPMNNADAVHHVARVHKRREVLHEANLRLVSDYNLEDHAAQWHIDEMWEYSRQTLDVCSGGYRPPVSRHVPAAALSEEAEAEAQANGAGNGWWAKRMAKIARARGAPLKKLVFFGNTGFGERKMCADILRAGLKGTGIQLEETITIWDWSTWVKAVGDPSAVFLNMHKDCLDESTQEGKMRAEESHAKASDMVYGQPLEPRVGLLLGAAGLVISQRAHPGDMRLYRGLANFTTLAEIPTLVKTLQAMPPTARQQLAMRREAVFRRTFGPSRVLQYAKIDQLLIERERLHAAAQQLHTAETKPARKRHEATSKRASAVLQPV